MTVRAKMYCERIITEKYSHGEVKTIEFTARYDQSIPEDMRFQKATPSGKITLQIDNPAAIEQFIPGKQYYVDFTPTEIA